MASPLKAWVRLAGIEGLDLEKPSEAPASREQLDAVEDRWIHIPDALISLWGEFDGTEDLGVYFNLMACTAFRRSKEENRYAWSFKSVSLLSTAEALDPATVAGIKGWEAAYIPFGRTEDGGLAFIDQDGALVVQAVDDPENPLDNIDPDFDALHAALMKKLDDRAIVVDAAGALVFDQRWQMIELDDWAPWDPPPADKKPTAKPPKELALDFCKFLAGEGLAIMSGSDPSFFDRMGDEIAERPGHLYGWLHEQPELKQLRVSESKFRGILGKWGFLS